ncbi:hypothetical protein [Gemmatimonas sp.]
MYVIPTSEIFAAARARPGADERIAALKAEMVRRLDEYDAAHDTERDDD